MSTRRFGSFMSPSVGWPVFCFSRLASVVFICSPLLGRVFVFSSSCVLVTSRFWEGFQYYIYILSCVSYFIAII